MKTRKGIILAGGSGTRRQFNKFLHLAHDARAG